MNDIFYLFVTCASFTIWHELYCAEHVLSYQILLSLCAYRVVYHFAIASVKISKAKK